MKHRSMTSPTLLAGPMSRAERRLLGGIACLPIITAAIALTVVLPGVLQ